MADIKITDYSELTTPASADVFEIVDDTTGTPTSKKVSLGNIAGNMPATTVTGTTTLDGDVGGTGVKDEDDMASDSAVALVTQQSIKAYVDGLIAGVVIFYNAYGEWADVKATTVEGGSSVVGWQTRTLSTEISDASNIGTLSANVVTVGAGTYEYHVTSFAMQPSRMRVRLWDVTAGSSIKEGIGGFANQSTTDGTVSELHGVVTLGVSTGLRIDQYLQASLATHGLGVAIDDGSDEIFSVLKLWRRA